MVYVIDEFTYLLESVPHISSTLQVAWDRRLKRSNIVLVLSGSHHNMMHEEFISGRRPLFGRTTADILLGELPPDELRFFLPRYSASQLVEAYGVVGGVPKYLEMWNGDVSVEQNLRTVILSPMTIFRQEPMVLIQDEISEPRTYLAILQALGGNRLSPQQISDRTGVRLPHMGKYLHTLETLRFVRKVASLASGDPLHTRLVRYEIRDAYLRFYFQFIAPNVQLLEQQRNDQLLRLIRKGFERFVAVNAFEELCRRYVEICADEGALPFEPQWVGQAFRRDVQIDVCAIDPETRNLLVGECKWHSRAMSRASYDELLLKVKKLRKLSGYHVHCALFSKTGFTRSLRDTAEENGVTLVGLSELGLTK